MNRDAQAGIKIDPLTIIIGKQSIVVKASHNMSYVDIT